MKKALKLTQDTIEQLDQYLDLWLTHSDTDEERQKSHDLYESLCGLIEEGNPYKEYEITEYENGYLVNIFSDTMGLSFFEEE